MLEHNMNKNGNEPTDPLPAPSHSQKSTTGRTRAIPPAFKHIQANGCKTPGCLNFGVPPRQGPILTGRSGSPDNYAIIGTGSEYLACRICKKNSTLKNNEAIHSELIRQGDQIWGKPELQCPNNDCANSNHSASNFKKHGTTRSGSQRFQCLACKKTFSIGNSGLLAVCISAFDAPRVARQPAAECCKFDFKRLRRKDL
jgi:hypothetical protein